MVINPLKLDSDFALPPAVSVSGSLWRHIASR
jgi:hypothetical protein